MSKNPVHFYVAFLHFFNLQSHQNANLECNAMEQRALKDVNNCLNTNIYFYLETSGGQSSILYLNVVYFFKTSVN
jgi:hypothetical protein